MPATTTTTILEPGGGITVWTNVIVLGVTTRIETTVEILEIYDDGVMVAITPPPANLEIETREGPLTDPSALD